MADSGLPTPVSGKATVIVFVALTFAFAGIIYYGKNLVQQRLPDAAPTPVDGGAPAAPGARLRGHCSVLGVDPGRREQPVEADAGVACSGEQIAWCDATGRHLGCCEPGLVAGPDGTCSCPSVGPLAPAAERRGCAVPATVGADAQAVTRSLVDAMPRIHDCYERVRAQAPDASTSVEVHFALTPEGEIFSAAVGRPGLPDRVAQACALEVLRSVRFSPPQNGFLEVRFPLSLAP